MAINRFNRPQAPARFNPLSFQEMSFAPTVLRERQDTLLNQQDQLLNNLNNIEVPDVFQDQFDKEKAQFTDEIGQLSDKINSEGAGNLNILGEFRNLRNRFNASVSKSGNIGRAAGAQESINATKDQFFKVGLEQGYNANIINQRWQEAVENYKSSLPADLSKHRGALPEFNPNFAPNNIDMISEVQKLSSLVKGSTEKTGGFRFVPNRQNGQIVNYSIINTKGEDISNDPNVSALRDYMRDRVLNPNSELNQVLAFKGIKPEEYLNQVDNITEMMRSNSKTVIESYAGQTPAINKTTGKGRSGRGSTTSGNASLIKQQNGMNELKTSSSVKAIEAAIEDIARDPEKTEADKNKEIAAYYHALVKKKQIEESPAFRRETDRLIGNSEGLQELGINSFAEYQEFINNEENQKPIEKLTQGASNSLVTIQTPSLADQADEMFQEVHSQLPKNVLAPSNYYTLGNFESDTKLQKIMSDGMQNADLNSLASEGVVSVMNNEGVFNKTGPTTDKESFEALIADVSESTNEKYHLKGIDDGGIAGDASLIYSVAGKAGDRNFSHSISIDMKNNDLSRQLLDPNGDLYKSLDLNSQLVLDQIRDNKLNYQGVPTDLSSNITYDGGSTSSIKQFSSRARSDFGIYPRGESDKLNDFLFVKPEYRNSTNTDRADYSIAINDDNSYSMYKRENGVTSYKTIGDMARQFMPNNYAAVKPGGNIGQIEHDRQYQNTYKQEFVRALVNSTLNIDNPKESTVYYSDNAEYNRLLKDYFNASQNGDPQLNQKALDIYDRISGMRLQSKNIKYVF